MRHLCVLAASLAVVNLCAAATFAERVAISLMQLARSARRSKPVTADLKKFYVPTLIADLLTVLKI